MQFKRIIFIGFILLSTLSTETFAKSRNRKKTPFDSFFRNMSGKEFVGKDLYGQKCGLRFSLSRNGNYLIFRLANEDNKLKKMEMMSTQYLDQDSSVEGYSQTGNPDAAYLRFDKKGMAVHELSMLFSKGKLTESIIKSDWYHYQSNDYIFARCFY